MKVDMGQDSLQSSLVKLAQELTNGKAVKTFSGGTNAVAVQLRHNHKKDTLIKIANTDGAGLNNGRRKLSREAKQIDYLTAKYPDFFLPILPKVLNVWSTNHYTAIEYPFYQGATLAEYIRAQKLNHLKLDKLLKQVARKIILGYLLYYKRRKNRFFQEKFINRAKFRINYSKRSHSIIKNLISKNHIYINGLKYQGSHKIISRIENDRKLKLQLETKYLSECVHGDINLRNVFIVNSSKFIFFDLRGSRQKWDIFYDLGKILFTSGFDRICHFEFKPIHLSHNKYLLKYANPRQKIHGIWENILDKLETAIESLPEFRLIINKEPYWKKKLRSFYAIHYLADCACRVEAGSPLNQAMTSYFLGTIYLNRFIKDVDARLSSHDYYSLKKII